MALQKIKDHFKSRNIDWITEREFERTLLRLHSDNIDRFPSIENALETFSLEEVVGAVLQEFKDSKYLENSDSSNLKNFKWNNSKRCCIAPYTTMNFDTMGTIRVCCYNNFFNLGKYPNVSIREAWDSPDRQKFIDGLKNMDFSWGCGTCKKQIIEGNVSNALFTSFDQYDFFARKHDPIVFNFDFGNICNYECIMCGGKWSSSIRKNREKLPPLKSPYDENFVKQLEPFISRMKVANFLGGEPFLNSIYYKIWDLILEKNPDLNMSITTNGSTFNSRIENYLTKFKNLKLNVSLDSLDKKTYEIIRKNGNFDNVIKNIENFKRLGRFGGIAFCPMIQNVYELPNIVQYAIDNKIAFTINDVISHLGGKIKGIHEGENENVFAWTGDTGGVREEIHVNNEELIPEVVIRTLPKEKIEDIIKHLNKFSFNDYPEYQKKYQSYINSLHFYNK
jgi:MoaA/NifB/PqqE/SkfB family radical SAM enzyme